MKTLCRWILLFSGVALLAGCQKKRPSETVVEERVFTPKVGESWTYQVDVILDPTADLPEGIIERGPEGVLTRYSKQRFYRGLKEMDDKGEMTHCFEVFKDGLLFETEFSLFNDEGIFSRGWKKSDESLIVMAPPVLLVPSKFQPGVTWTMSLPNPNDPSGPPMFHRQFQYFGEETITIMNQSMVAHRVKVFGKTGPVELQRDFWFSDRIGFLKERRAYYIPSKRIALFDEELVEHEVPE